MRDTYARARRDDQGSGELRVYQVIKGLGRGGAEMLLLEMERARPAELRYAFGYFLEHKNALVEELRSCGASVTLHRWRSPASFPAVVLSVARRLRAWRAHLVHAHLPISGVVARLAGRIARVPVLYTEHNLMERYHRATRLANLATWGWQRRVLAVSREVAESARRHAGDRVAIEVLRNGVPVERLRADPERGLALRDELAIPRQSLVVGTVAVFRTQKRIDEWLEAARILSSQRADLVFLLVGDGPLRLELEARGRALGLANGSGGRLRWAGLRSDVSACLSAMDVYLMSSEFEGLPLALLEAMAHELPVVATTVGGIPEVVERGVSGDLVAPHRPEEMASQVGRLLDDAELRARYGVAARQRVIAEFSMARMSRDLFAAYDGLIDRGSRIPG
jgi:glycosyltransferase involved in cell wall biosynthesis